MLSAFDQRQLLHTLLTVRHIRLGLGVIDPERLPFIRQYLRSRRAAWVLLHRRERPPMLASSCPLPAGTTVEQPVRTTGVVIAETIATMLKAGDLTGIEVHGFDDLMQPTRPAPTERLVPTVADRLRMLGTRSDS